MLLWQGGAQVAAFAERQLALLERVVREAGLHPMQAVLARSLTTAVIPQKPAGE